MLHLHRHPRQLLSHLLFDIQRPHPAREADPSLGAVDDFDVAELGEVGGEEGEGLVGFVYVRERRKVSTGAHAVETMAKGEAEGGGSMEEDVPKPIASKGLFATAVQTSSNLVGLAEHLIATTSHTLGSRLNIAFRLYSSAFETYSCCCASRSSGSTPLPRP
jgi:hypothetical protein